jgi:diaminohydroxyphosphoribosylaminopyrimidine deaminase / 5-amino-6-(5-phosphoribosylamino)uracil reductase
VNDADALHEALKCARSVIGRTSPRPPVGAIIVQDGQIVGRGATSPPFGPHAEVVALADAGDASHGADLYVTLEPCCVTIHTPPCTEAIIAAGIRRVIIGAIDPNPLVAGRGISQLASAGIAVLTMESTDAQELIRPFAKFITQHRPYVTAKWAMTLDGKIATEQGDARWISGSESRAWVHDLRDRVDAILIGSGTARADDPLLTVRIPDHAKTETRVPRLQDPLRIILATQGNIPDHLHLLQQPLAAGTCIMIGETCSLERRAYFEQIGIDVVCLPEDTSGHLQFKAVLQVLAERGIMHVLIEGGATIFGTALEQQCIDHVAAFIAPKLIGGMNAPSPIGGAGIKFMEQAISLHSLHIQTIGQDILVEGDL